MTITLEHHAGSRTLEVGLSGVVTKDDLQTLSDQVKRMLRSMRGLRVLIAVRRFAGWDASSQWRELDSGSKHLAEIEKLGIVGDTDTNEGIESFCKPFVNAQVRNFAPTQLDLARSWLEQSA